MTTLKLDALRRITGLNTLQDIERALQAFGVVYTFDADKQVQVTDGVKARAALRLIRIVEQENRLQLLPDVVGRVDSKGWRFSR